ncbi:MAG: alpha/beta fold hydrolase [Oscillospiraceae bacterium]|nr:alpha/beta fold hydrolase [Oscillospiraceae bacterium]
MKKLIMLLTLVFLFTACGGNDSSEVLPEKESEFPQLNNENPLSEESESEKRFIEIPVIIGEGSGWELDGILTLPDNTGQKVPAVVLVHGSGPSDMNGTVYENKPFLEIAEYLSSNGIAVIRYDKRTFTHGAKMLQELGGSFTVWEETIKDALSATEILKADPRINENKVYILGHSMGGSLAPRIHAMGGNYAGLILYAGTPRSLMELMADQQFLAVTETMEGEELEEMTALFQSGIVKEQITAVINTPDEEAKTQIDTFGTSVYYYKDLEINPADMFIENITAPFLVMHADNDFQVFTDKDFALYKELLSGRSNVTFKLYENLNHLFMPSTVTRSVDIHDEYKIKANVDGQVLKDIADWIQVN